MRANQPDVRWVFIAGRCRGGYAADPEPAESAATVRDWRYVLTIHEIARADDDVHLMRLVTDNPDRMLVRLPDGRTAVHAAAEVGALRSLNVLAHAGADLNVTDGKGRTALSIATGMDFATTVKTLAQLGADVNRDGVADEGSAPQPPLTIAARHGFVDVMRILLEAKADMDRKAADAQPA